MGIRRIKKNTKSFFMIWLFISTLSVVFTLIWNPSNIIDYIISIISVSVTTILGVVTYFQSEAQLEIDNISKKPFCKIVNFKYVGDYSKKGYKSYGIETFSVDELLGIEMEIKPKKANSDLLTYFVPIELTSEGDIDILSINGYVYDKANNQFIKNSNSWFVDSLYNSEIFKIKEPKAYKFTEILNDEWVIPTFINVRNKTDDSYKCTFKIELGDTFENVINKMSMGEFRFEYIFAFEIVTIAGYVYTQLISVKLFPFAADPQALENGVFKVVCGLMDYQTSILSKSVNEITQKDLKDVSKLAKPKVIKVKK